MSTPGFRIAVHNSLTKPILLAGVPRRLAILNGTLCAALTLGLHLWYGIPIALVIHVSAYYLTRKDPSFFDVILRHTHQKNYYST